MKIRSALIVGLAVAMLMAVGSIAITVRYQSQIEVLEKVARQARVASRNVAGLLAMEQDAVLHASPRASRQWHAIHAELLQSMHTLVDHLSPQNKAMGLAKSIISVAEALPDQFDAIFTNSNSDSSLDLERRETLVDHLTIETRRISEGAFDLTEMFADQRAAVRAERLQVQSGFMAIFLLFISFGVWFTFRRILAPLTGLTAAALEVQRGNMSVRNALTSRNEMGLLGRAFNDMTLALQERQQKLVESQRETASLYKAIDDHSIVSTADRNGNIITVNDAFCRISGYSREELVGQNHRIINSGVLSADFWVNFWSTIKSGTAWHGEICNRAKDGSLYWVDSMVMPMRDEAGNIEKYISIRNDITARKESQAALQVSNSLLEESQKVAKVGGWELSLETNVLYWTAETYRILETSPDEFDPTVDAGVQNFLPESRERLEQALKLAIDQGKPYDLELETYTSKGNRIDVRATCTPWVVDGKVIRLSGIFQDMTQRKQYERELKVARDSAQQAALSKGQFLANMSHEIRTPMNAILGLLNLLQSTELTSRQRDYASKTEGAARSLLGLLNDILDFSKVEAGKMAMESEPFHIDKLMRNLSVVLSANVGTKDIEVLFDIDPTLPLVLRGDAMRLQQVLINLGGNAVKFTSEGQVVLSLRKLVQTEHTATVEFAVRDTGIGIAPEHQAHIFDGFSQAEGSTTRRFGGTGLGLAISKRFVELMGGTIKVTSELGVGSTFTCTLDMPTVNAAEIQAPSPSDPNGTPQRVLVVDDNPIAAELTLRMVRSWGWTADLAKSGKEAIEHLSAQCATAIAEFPYPVIYMDWKMPGMDGWETTRQIRQLSERSRLPHPTVIMLTAHGLETLTHRSEAEQELINGFLVKPATASMLYDAWMDAQAGKAGIRKTSKGRSSTRQLQGMRILVVEDNLINQQVAEELLNSEGATVSLAANGQLGVDAVAAAAPQFDVVLMDVQMPVLDGYGATRAIREDLQLQYLPIVAMTANVMASDRDACLAAGMNEHIGKPFDMAKLVSLLIRMTGLQPQMLETPASALISTEPTELPVIPGLALDAAVRRMSGMRFLYIRTAESFAKALDTEVSEISRDIEAGDTQMVKMRLHTLKGNAVTLGTNELALKAGLLEKVCQSPSGFEECAASLDDLGELCQSAKRLLLRAISELETGVISPEKIRVGVDVAPSDDSAMSNETAGTLVSRLQALNGLLSNDDLSAVEMFAEIRSEFPDSMYDRVETLEHAIQSLDLEAAQKHANELIAFLTATH